MEPLTVTNKQTEKSIRTTTCNFFFELQWRQIRKYAKAFGMNSSAACTAPPGQRIAMSTEKEAAIPNPIKARD